MTKMKKQINQYLVVIKKVKIKLYQGYHMKLIDHLFHRKKVLGMS